ncbi:Uncharacterised protein [Mycobacteroides abscessus subsp. abscessus]|nr:Uncharacterised protein [Mycobacteroides abscessus subsp. abscessus]
MPGEILRALPDVEDLATVDVARRDQRDAGHVVAGGYPGAQPTVEFADNSVEPDLRRLPRDVGGVLIGVPHHDHRPVRRDQPAEPAREHRSQGIGDGATDVRGGEALQWPGVHEHGAVGELRPDGIDGQRPQRRVIVEHRRTQPVDLAQTPEVWRVAAERTENL